MSLTPDDIVNYPLKQSVRGYSVRQVDELLDQVADALERAQQRVADLERRLSLSEQQLAASSETESTLKRTLVTAQKAAERSIEEAKERSTEIVEDARREAEVIVEEARLEAEQLRLEAVRAARAEEAEIRRRRQELERHIESLRVFERDHRSRLRAHLEEHLRMLDDLGGASESESPPAVPEAAGRREEQVSFDVPAGHERHADRDDDLDDGRAVGGWSGDPFAPADETESSTGGDPYDWLAGPTPSGMAPEDSSTSSLFGFSDDEGDESDESEEPGDETFDEPDDGPRLTVRVREDEVDEGPRDDDHDR